MIYLFIHDRERGRDTGRGRSRLHAGSPTRDSIPGLQDRALGRRRRQTAEPPRDPPQPPLRKQKQLRPREVSERLRVCTPGVRAPGRPTARACPDPSARTGVPRGHSVSFTSRPVANFREGCVGNLRGRRGEASRADPGFPVPPRPPPRGVLSPRRAPATRIPAPLSPPRGRRLEPSASRPPLTLSQHRHVDSRERREPPDLSGGGYRAAGSRRSEERGAGRPGFYGEMIHEKQFPASTKANLLDVDGPVLTAKSWKLSPVIMKDVAVVH
ncbi:uncharacterized protein LOC121497892 isoform X2 [Vulpes lagopus]|nr:uncharacterized protein LOC121497892 isoform X2 [Vulpes lagopus]